MLHNTLFRADASNQQGQRDNQRSTRVRRSVGRGAAVTAALAASLAVAPLALADTGGASSARTTSSAKLLASPAASTMVGRAALSSSSACLHMYVGSTGPLLRYGSRGSAVRSVQCVMIAWSRTSIAVDGIYGPATRDKVIGFQRTHGLVPDGVVGKYTWNALYHYYWGR